MIMDTKLLFADAVDVSAAAGTAAIGDQVDLETTDRRLGSAMNMKLVIGVTTAFTSGTSSTVVFQLVSDAVNPTAADGTETVHAQSEVFTDAELTLGAQIIIPLPAGLPLSERYLGIQVVTGSATTTAGSISAFLVTDAQDWVALPDAAN